MSACFRVMRWAGALAALLVAASVRGETALKLAPRTVTLGGGLGIVSGFSTRLDVPPAQRRSSEV